MKSKMSKIDYIILLVMILIYSLFSFYNLGSFDNPNTFTNKNIDIKLKENQKISKIRYFTGHQMNSLDISFENENKNTNIETNLSYVFSWNDVNVSSNVDVIHIKLDEESFIGEIALYDELGNKLNNNEFTVNRKEVVDEGNVIPNSISNYNSTYFDEIYFARTAYEYANDLEAYEWIHPPLGKILISIPIKLFKMAPFYYRFMSNLAGILMIPVLYILGKRIFKKTIYALLPALFMMIDTFHFAHTRMCQIDGFLVLFILLSFLFMYEYINSDKKSLNKKLLYLFLSGLFMGLALCTKWTASAFALALAIIFFYHFIKNYNNIDKKDRKKIIIANIFFFVIIPIIIYISLYLLFPNMYYFKTDSLPKIIEITKSMYDYHSSLKAPHDFYSRFYTWPFMIKPVWYYTSSISNMKATISGFGNPILWWSSAISIIYLIYNSIKNKNKDSLLILIVYVCLFIPYLFITRGMFLYHYFPMLPFAFLSLTFLIKKIDERVKNSYFYVSFLVLVIFFSYYFYPIVSATYIENSLANSLKWLSTWVF